MKQQVLETLYELYSKEIYLYAFSLCKDYHLAQDLVSDTFFKALIALKDNDVNIKYWLLKVCKNLWLDSLKYKKRFSDTPFDDNAFPVNFTGLEKLINDEQIRLLYKAILTLPPNCTEIIYMFYFCNISLNNISKELNISPGAARTLLFRSRQRLKNILKEDLS